MVGPQPRIAALIALLLVPQAADARTWYVSPEGWGDSPTIQAALDSTAVGDSVLVLPGTYFENLVVHRAIHLTSAGGAQATTIDGGNQDRVLTIASDVTEGMIIAGFTLKRGFTRECGGGVLISCSGATLRDNIIELNVAGTHGEEGCGGGVALGFGTTACLLENNVVRNNIAGNSGGGISAGGANHVIRSNVITRNSCHVTAGGIGVGGASLSEFNLITENHSDGWPGGAFVRFGTFVNNTVANNTTSYGAVAGVLCDFGAQVMNNIVVDNHGSDAAGIGCFDDRYVMIACNDSWGNDLDALFGCERATIVSNVSVDPLFCSEDPIYGFGIARSSHCAPENSGGCGLIGARPVGCTVTSVAKSSWSAVKQLYLYR